MLISKVYNYTFIVFIIISSLFLYFFEIQQANEYAGMQYFIIEIVYLLILAVSLIFIGLFLSTIRNNNLPSYNLLYLFILFVIIWNIIFYKSTNLLSCSEYLLWFLIIILSLLCIVLLNKMWASIIKKIFFKINFLRGIKIEYLLSLFLLVVLIIIALKMPLNFDFNGSYVRRLEGRKLITGINGYLFATSMNSVAPFLAFLAFLNKRYIYFFIAFIFAILCFGFIGVKAPVGYVIILSFIGFIYSRYQNINVFNLFLIIIFCIFFLALIEYFLFDHSIIADIIIRRAFVLNAQIQTYFIDFIVSNFALEHWVFGSKWNENGKSITFLIGDMYFNNADTNAFLYPIFQNILRCYLALIIFFYNLKTKLKEEEFVSLGIRLNVASAFNNN